MAKLFQTPPGSPNAFAAFVIFIKEMEAQNCTGLEIDLNGKRYTFSAVEREKLLTPNINNQDGKLHRN